MMFLANKNSDEVSIWKLISGISLLALLCIITFLVAKYIVRDSIGWEKPPVDVSERF